MNTLDTSIAAHEVIKPKAAAIRNQIETYIHDRRERGSTCDEVEVALDLKHQTASARIKELKDEGRLYDSGERRETRSGCAAAVYRTP